MTSFMRRLGAELATLLVTTDPGGVTGTLSLYTKLVGGVTALFAQANDGTIQQVTGVGGGVPSSRAVNTTAPLTGGGDLSADRTLSLDNNGVTDAKLRQGAALSVIGNATNALANVADIVAGSDGDVMRRSGVGIGFGTIPQSSVVSLVADLALKSPIASPTFTGVPAAPTAVAGTSTTQLATTAFVAAATTAVIATPINNVTAVLQNPLFAAGNASVKNYGLGVGGAVYLCRLPVALAGATVTVFYKTTTALVIGTTGTRYGEIGLATGAVNPGGNPTLTGRFYADASASGATGMQGTIGIKSTTITGVTLAAGSDLWLIFSADPGTGGGASGVVFRGANNVDDLAVGMSATRAAYQPSVNIGSALAFTAEAASVVPILTRIVLP